MGHSVFDEFLVATHDEDVFVGVVITLVSCVEPAVADCIGRLFRMIQIFFQHCRRLNANLTLFVSAELLASGWVDDLQSFIFIVKYKQFFTFDFVIVCVVCVQISPKFIYANYLKFDSKVHIQLEVRMCAMYSTLSLHEGNSLPEHPMMCPVQQSNIYHVFLFIIEDN